MMLGPVSSENEGAGSGIGRVRAFSLVIRAIRANAHVHPHFTLETPSDMGATHCPSQPMILRPILVISRAPSQMEYAIRHMVVFNSKAYANI